jgi:hypothetical protein
MTQTPPTRRWRRKLLAPLAIGLVAVTAASTVHGSTDDLAAVRRATASFNSVRVAERAGYQRFVDVHGIACIDMPGLGGMGIHYVNGELVDDADLNPRTPEAMVYRPVHGGQLRLGAVEYIVFQSLWDAQHDDPPSLFGQTFDFTSSPNRFGLPAFYSLHVWVWKHNSAGTFAMFNPDVQCKL